MFNTPCELSMYLEKLTSQILDLEGKSKKKWKVKETSITDVLIASFMSHNNFPWVEVDGSVEAITNADFEVILRRSGYDITFLVQAKRTHVSSSGTVSIPELYHPKSTGTQNQDLIDYALNNGAIPLYSFYLSSLAISNLQSFLPNITIHGIMLASACTVRTAGFRKKPKKNILQAKKILHQSVPFHSRFCPGSAHEILESLATLGLDCVSDEPKRIKEFIVPSISLENRRARDHDRPRTYRQDKSALFSVFRVLIDFDRMDSESLPPKR